MRPVPPCPDRYTGGLRHRISAHQPLAVSRRKTSRRSGIKPRQPLPKRRTADGAIKCGCLVPDRVRNFRKRRKPVLQCVQVKPGAADDDRQPFRCSFGGDLGERERPPSPG